MSVFCIDILCGVFVCYCVCLLFIVLLLWIMMLVGMVLLGLFGGFFIVVVLVGVVGLGSGFNFFLFLVGICGLMMVCIVLCYFEKLVGYDVILCIVCDLCVWFFCCVLLLVLVCLVGICIGELLVWLMLDIGEVDGLLVCVIGLLFVFGGILLVGVFLVGIIYLSVVVLLVVLMLLVGIGVLWLIVCGVVG